MRFFFLLATLVAVATAQQQCGCAAPQPIQIQLSCGGQQPIPQPPPQECVAPAPAPEPQPEPEPEPEPEPATEGPANEAVACMTDNDLALVIDSSTSWSIGTYNSAIDFAAQFAKTWRENPGNGVTLNTFASVGETPIPLTHSMTPDEIHDAIKAVPWLQGSIRVDLGIDEARRQLAGSDRAGVPKNIVVFTDGVTDDWSLLDASLANVANEGQRVFVVAMGAVAGGGAMQEQLKKIALGHEDHIFYVEEIGGDGLMNILRDISQRACEADAPPTGVPARRR